MKRVGVAVSVRELLACLVVASFTMSCTQLQLHYKAAAAGAATVAAPRGQAPSAASLSKRVDLVHRSGFGLSNLSIDDILNAENHRVAFIMAKLSIAVGEPQDEQLLSSPLYSGRILGSGNYIMQLGLGTPANNLYLVIDTGSDLAWTQCLPCDACYAQNDPIFDPSASSSYQQVLCASPQCTQLSSRNSGSCSNTNAVNCDYLIHYLDNSSTTGDFALETLTVGSDVAAAAYPFGCGHQNQGLFTGFDGIIGFSRDSLAFPAQTQATFGKVFAYCMPPILSSSAGYIEFGLTSGKGGGGSLSTPLVMLSETPLYVVELENVQVEGTNSMSKPTRSNAMVVDSGTVITRLDRPLYEQVRDAFKQAASSMMEAPPGAGMGLFDTCYIDDGTSVFPRITFAFMGGLAFTPIAQNSVVTIDEIGTTCLALAPLDSNSGSSILGNYQQQGRIFTFDIPFSTLSISSADAC